MTKTNSKPRRGGFTLVEVLIVVVILGILAATVLPQFATSSDNAKESAVVQNLQLLRSQIQMYKFQHEGNLPAATALETQLTSKTDIKGVPSPTGEFGPYIIGQLPPNPFNGLRDVTALGTAPDNKTGWMFDTTSGTLKINSSQKLKSDANNDGKVDDSDTAFLL